MFGKETVRIPVFEKTKIKNSNVWKIKKIEFQCLEKAKIKNSNVSKRQHY